MGALSFKRDVDKREYDMGILKFGNVIEEYLEKNILKDLGLGNRYNCF